MIAFEQDVEKILLTEAEIQQRVSELAEELAEVYQNEEVVLVCILKGSVVFYCDLAKRLPFPVVYDFICASSYGSSSVSGGEVRILKDLAVDIADKNVLIVEDILDTGYTLHALLEKLQERKPKSLRICSLLDKPSRRKKAVDIDFVGFVVPDEFVVGYGLDYNEFYRQLPYIGVLKRSVYES